MSSEEDEDDLAGPQRYGASEKNFIKLLSKRPKFVPVEEMSSSSSSSSGSDSDSDEGGKHQQSSDEEEEEEVALKPVRSVLRVPPPQATPPNNQLEQMKRDLNMLLQQQALDVSEDEDIVVRPVSAAIEDAVEISDDDEDEADNKSNSSSSSDEEEGGDDMELTFKYGAKKYTIACQSTLPFSLAANKFVKLVGGSGSFTYKTNGTKLSLEETPQVLELEDEDQVDVKLST